MELDKEAWITPNAATHEDKKADSSHSLAPQAELWEVRNDKDRGKMAYKSQRRLGLREISGFEVGIHPLFNL